MLSIIVVSYNTRLLLQQCLASLSRHAPAAEVIVVDNASRDGSVEMVRVGFPHIRMVVLPENRGFAAANNAGLGLASGESILLLNSDTVIEDDSLDRCVDWLQENPDVGALSPRLVGVDDKPQPCLYPFPTLGEISRNAFRLGKPAPAMVADGWLAGTALLLRREALQDVGGQLDAGYFMYWEDADLSARLRAAGWQRVAYPNAHVRHYGGASGGGDDSCRPANLFAWYTYGQHRWFARHRPLLESVGLWLLDAIDVPRRLLRSWVRPHRSAETRHAWMLLRVLCWRLLGKAPPRPGVVK
jgi:N-acetylglucosaminyl-diphospho-decaprenol L-rhamnosyltransferase